MMPNNILIVDDQPEILKALERLLKDRYQVFTAASGLAALEIVKQHPLQVILADQRMPGMTGAEFLARSIEYQPHAVRMMITAYSDIQATIQAVNEGKIFYYISKPWEPDDLLLIISRAAEHFQLGEENHKLTVQLKEANQRLAAENLILQQNAATTYDFSNIIGGSPKLLQVFKLTSKVINTPTTVLLLGETGTGKEMLARAIHYNSNRKNKLFIAQNCAALPDTLLESELFGHVRGAFTGAFSDKKGIFALADGGTVFLDEIADTTSALQMRLLRVLQEGEIRPVGSESILKISARVIAATNKNLETEVKEGRFREDLYYRLNVFPVTLPPLRERREDIPDLVNFFIRKFAIKINKAIQGITPEALDMLYRAPFPGNVRELENEIERAVTLAEDNAALTPDLLSLRFHRTAHGTVNSRDEKISLKNQVESLEISLIEEALRSTNGNILKAAEKLHLSRAGLHKKLNRYHINLTQLKI